MARSHFVGRLPLRRWFALVTVITALALVATLASTPANAARRSAAPVAIPSPSAPAASNDGLGGALSAPDATSAAAIARLEKAPVEILAERTESESVFMLPDGTRAAGVASGPVWVRRGGDGTKGSDWAPVDLTLKASSDGSVQPVAQVGSLTLSGGSTQADASVDLAALTDPSSGARTSVQWQGVLPRPELSGRRATYREVQPGVDLVVEATNTGFEQYMVVKTRPAVGTDLSFPMTLHVDGAQVSQGDDGSIVATAGGKTVAEAGAPQMWDASTDLQLDNPVTQPRAAEDPTAPRLAPMPAWVTSKNHSAKNADAAGSTSQASQAASGNGPHSDKKGDVAGRLVKVDRSVNVAGKANARVALQPSTAFLQDPATTYPVVIDPDVNLNNGFDTWVQSGYSTPHPSDTQLDFGNPGTGHVARAFITFPLASFLGASVSSARFEMYDFYSWSCLARNWQIYSTWGASSSTTWDSQPGWGSLYATSSDTHGYSSSCPGDWARVDVTQLAKDWAAGGGTQGYIGIRAADESDSYAWKRVYSADNGSYIPSIWVTYNYTPTVPTGVKVSSPNGPTTGAFVSTKTPTLSATVSDPDGGNLAVDWQVKTSAGSLLWDSGFSAINVPSGSVATATVPAGYLADGGSYQVVAMAGDGTTQSAFSAPVSFTVDSTPPGAPTVFSSDYPADQTWHKDANQAGTFTFTASPADTTVVGYQWGLDQAPLSTQQVAVANGATGTVSITPTTVGRHTLQVRAIDRAGNGSAQVAKYSFLVGRAGILTPEEGAKVVRRVQISLGTNDATLKFAKFQWRRGPDSTTQTDIAAAALTTSDGKPFAVGYNPVPSGVGAYSTWDAATTLGYVGGPVQVRAAVASDTSGTGMTYTQWVTVTVDPEADDAATSDIGPGSVNLLTGDYKVSVTDAQEFGLSVLRTTSSRDTDSGYQLQPDQLSTTQRDGTYNAAEFANATATVSQATTQFHQGGTSYKLTATSAGTVDTYAAVGGDAGALRLGLVPGATYRVSAWIYVPSATGLSPGSARGESVALFTRVGSGAYSEPSTSGQQTPRPTVVDAWQQRTVDVTVPSGATEAFFRLYNGFDGSTGKSVYFDDLSIRRIWAPFGVAWSMGAADDTAGTAYTKITQPYDDVAAVNFATGGDVWFTTGDGQTWFPEPGAESLKLTRTGTDSWRLTELDGTFTDFTRPTGSSGDFTVDSTAPPAVPGQARYIYANAGGLQRLSRIIAPIETGVDGWGTTNPQACTEIPTPAVGCEVLDLDYAATTTATATAPGDFAGQVQSVSAWVYTATSKTMVKTVVAKYQYVAAGQPLAGQLVSVQDPRVSPALDTKYTYDLSGRLASITPAGELPYTFSYGVAGAQITGAGDWIDPSPGRLLSVSRGSLVQGTTDQVGPTNTTSVVYAVPLTTSAGGPYDLSPNVLAWWAQSDGPTDGTAVFGPQNPPSVSTATSTNPGKGGYAPATVHYLNASGLEVDTASPAGPNAPTAGYIDVTEYDTSGKVIRTLDATNRLLAIGELPNYAALIAQLGLTGKGSAQLSTLLDTRNTYTQDGLALQTVLGPIDKVAVANNPSDVQALRPYAQYVYDEKAPDGGIYHLLTSTTTSGRDPVTGTLYDSSTTVNTYNPIDGASALGGSSGWLHGTPTTVTVDVGGANLTSQVLLDANGRPISSRMPGSGVTDAGTVNTVYYTAAVNPNDPCANHPEWAGQACTTSNAGAATGSDATRAAPSLPVKNVTAYDGYGNPVTVVETATGPVAGGSATDTRTTTTTYDAAGRVTAVEITGTGAGVGTSVAKTTTVYDGATGEVASIQSPNASGGFTTIKKTYDKLGRLVTYDDGTGGITTTTYDRYGRPATVNESIGTSRSYAYNDPRGYVTSVTDSVAGTINATWGPDGQLTTETLPGDVTLKVDYDAAQVATSRTYTRTSTGDVIAQDGGVRNQRGQWISRSTAGRQVNYQYDSIGRLTSAVDLAAFGGSCVARAYAYDTHSNRTGFASVTTPAGQACPQVPTPATTNTYDSADRLMSTSGANSSAWTYDPFGRTTTMPTPDGSDIITNTYYVNDQVAAQTPATPLAGSTRKSWILDPIQRRSSTQTDQWVNGAWASSTTAVNHFDSDSDEPTWINEDASLPSAVTRFVEGVDGDSAMTTSTTGNRVLQLVDLQGSVIGTLPIADGATAATWTGLRFAAFDEFGNPINMSGSGSTNGPPARYGWLGADQRSADALGGVILMGQRLYLPGIGRFLSVDPVPGGSANAYDYCNGDPVNCTDLQGTFAWKKFAGVVAAVASVASIIPGPIGMAAGAVSVVAYVAAGDKKQALLAAAGIALAAVGAGVAVAAARAGTAARATESGVAAGRLATRAAPRAERAVEAATESCNSFIPGTLVLMADGTLRPIEELNAGALVISTDPATGVTEAEPVLAPIVGQGEKHLVEITTDAGTWTATANHPVWVEGKGWTLAVDLSSGDVLRGSSGEPVVVRGTNDRGFVADQTVYNLHVAGSHTYYIATRRGNALVHNSACSITSNAARRAAMREAGIPTSSQPVSQLRTESGMSYVYESGGRKYGVVQATMDRSHPGMPHWEAGPLKSPIKLSPYGIPRLQNVGKARVFY